MKTNVIEKPLSHNFEEEQFEDEVRQVDFTNTVSGGRIPPHSLESEQAVFGAAFLDNETLNAVVEILRPDDFYTGAHRTLFQAVVDLWEKREPIDVVTLTSVLKSTSQLELIGGVEYLSYLIDAVPTAANVQYYARVIRAMSLRRKVIHEAGEITTDAFALSDDIDTFIDSVEQRIFKISESRLSKGFLRAGDLVKDSIEKIQHRYLNKEEMTGVTSGFKRLDEITSGFQPSDLIIIAGRPSMGKTSLALAIGRYVGIHSGQAVAIFSLEMSQEQISMRMLCSQARVNNSHARSGKLGESDFPRLVEAASQIAQSNIFIDDTPAISVLEMRAKARRLHRETPLSLIIVDYLQLMRGSHRKIERREQEISEISGSLKALARELSLPIIALSQLNRSVETRQDKRPIMADLRESGAIEQDADIIGFVYRDEVYNPDTQDKGIAEFIVSKHRNGPIGFVKLAFQADFTEFTSLATEREYDYLGEDMNLKDGGDFL